MAQSIEAFGKYLLLEKLAVGGMAEVYLAKSFGANGIGKFVAVKRILPQFSDDQEFIDMFKEEAKIVMNLNHSNIVSIYDFGVEKGAFFLVMEFVEGQNLRQTLTFLKKNQKSFSIDQIVYVVKEVAAGLDHAHRCIDQNTGKVLNITHRDMSPQNVMVSFEGEVKVVDFGIAKAETQLEQTRSGTIKGKFGYMSPEQAEGQIVDFRTDIFSIGIVLWELLAQDRLFTAQSEAATLKKIKDCQIPPIRKLNPSVPVDLEKIVSKCLVRDRNHRYQSAEALSKDLNRFLNTHYPEFSKQEFSKFLKALYQDMFLENRKKLADYAKIDHEPNGGETIVTKTMVGGNTQTEAQGQTVAPQPRSAKPPEPVADDSEDQDLHMNPEDSVKIDLDKLKVRAADNNNAKSMLVRKTGSNISLRNTGQSMSKSHNSSIHAGGVNPGTQGRYIVKPSPQRSHSSVSGRGGGGSMFTTFIFVCALGFGYWYWQQKTVGSAELPQKDTPLTRPATVAGSGPVSDATVIIDSAPQGATVTMNGQVMGATPIRTHMPPGSGLRYSLTKPGFLPYEAFNETVPAEGFNKVIRLLAEPPSGKVSIQAYNAGPQPKVYVDNVLVAQTLPAEVKIKAGTQVTIKIVNPLSRTMGVEEVVVGQGQTKSVYVILNKQAQVQ